MYLYVCTLYTLYTMYVKMQFALSLISNPMFHHSRRLIAKQKLKIKKYNYNNIRSVDKDSISHFYNGMQPCTVVM